MSEKKYITKKLPHFQVMRVISRTKERQMLLRQIREPFVIDGIPEGHFAISQDKVLLPKRKRGEKFIVHYTTVQEAIL